MPSSVRSGGVVRLAGIAFLLACGPSGARMEIGDPEDAGAGPDAAPAAPTPARPDGPLAADRVPVVEGPDPTPPAPPAPDAMPVVALPDAGPDGPAADGPAPAAPDAGDPPPAGVWVNSLGMRFVPLPGTGVLISIWETRVQDFDVYGKAVGYAYPRPSDYTEGPLQPVAAIPKAQALMFARWLTERERQQGRLGPAHSYRLPLDSEWDLAVQAGKTGGEFPWGASFPPPDDFANYGVSKDGFAFTAPVGSFAPNKLGLYDVAGNLWEYIQDGCGAGKPYLVRGAGFNANNRPYFASAFHYCFSGDLGGHHNVGFRLVLEGGRPQ
jgi:hypothetical protein